MHQNLEHNDDINTSFSFTDNLEEDVITTREAELESQIAELEKLDTIGGINFDSVIIADFEEALKSVATSLIYTDIPPTRVTYITLNQWFDKSLFNEVMIQPIYFPSVNYENYQDTQNNNFGNEAPQNCIMFLKTFLA